MKSRMAIFLSSLLVFSGLAVFAATLGRGIYYGAESGAVPIFPVGKEPLAAPARLLIPSLSVDAKVQRVGMNARGNMGTPSNFTDVGWYEYGTVPGEQGSAVIDGHVDNGLGMPGVFKRLGEIKVGDDIYTATATGTATHFMVTSIDAYDYKSAPTDLIFNEGGAARLKLITCAGDWVSGDKTYDKRLVVTAIHVD